MADENNFSIADAEKLDNTHGDIDEELMYLRSPSNHFELFKVIFGDFPIA
jgi:hypothetical protein